MGADPIVSNVATASAWRAQSHPGAPLLHGFLVRKAEKAHGTGRRIEGFCREGARVVIVDDVCTTGASTIVAIEAAREAGMTVAAVVCIVEREEANGRPAVEGGCEGQSFLSSFHSERCARGARETARSRAPARGGPLCRKHKKGRPTIPGACPFFIQQPSIAGDYHAPRLSYSGTTVGGADDVACPVGAAG